MGFRSGHRNCVRFCFFNPNSRCAACAVLHFWCRLFVYRTEEFFSLFIWDFVASTVMDDLIDWFYGQLVGFLGNFFAQMGNMGVELFDLEWVQAVILFFSKLAWALFAVSLVVRAFECGIEYASGRANLQQTALDMIKGFFAVSLFTTVPVRLYALSVSLQGTLSVGLTGSDTTIGEVGQHILNPPLRLMQFGRCHHLHSRCYLACTLDGAYSIFYLFQ